MTDIKKSFHREAESYV